MIYHISIRRICIATAFAITQLMQCKAIAQNAASISPVLPIIKYNNTEQPLNKWLLIGPFDEGRGTTDHDSLENVTVIENLKNIQMSGRRQTVIDPDDHCIDLSYILNQTFSETQPSVAAYLATEIDTLNENVTLLALKASGRIEVWLNGKRINSTEHANFDYQDPIYLRLTKGRNLLLIKSYISNIDWLISARLEPSLFAFTQLLQDATRSVMQNAVILPGEKLAFTLKDIPNNVALNVSIKTCNDVLIDSPSITGENPLWSPPENIPPGVYYCSMNLNGKMYDEEFCIGDPRQIVSMLAIRANRYKAKDGEASINIAGIERRLQVLLDHANWEPKDQEWQRKVVFTIKQYSSIIKSLDDNQNPFRDAIGLHILGFKSKIDDNNEYYRLFVPDDYKRDKNPLPLAVILPMLPSASRPFIDSAFIARHIEAEEISSLANAQHIGILWCGYHGKPHGYPIDFEHFNEAISAVESDYQIDPSRLYLIGMCSSGVTASMYAVTWPRRFAAIGYLDPIFHRYRNQPMSLSDRLFISFPEFRKWLDDNDPVMPLLKLKDIPLHVIFDGAAEGHGEHRFSLEFIERAKESKKPVIYDETAKTDHHHLGAWNELFKWLRMQKSDSPSDARSAVFPWKAGRTGPISTVFTDPFLVVIGTKGDITSVQSSNAIADNFVNEWTLTHYGRCRVMRDTDVSVADQQNFNLILIGNSETNIIWKKMVDGIPIVMRKDYVRIDNNEIRGDNLSIQCVLQNPYFKNRKLLLIGGSYLPDIKFGTLDLASDGWYDYSVWDNKKNRCVLVSADIFHPSNLN